MTRRALLSPTSQAVTADVVELTAELGLSTGLLVHVPGFSPSICDERTFWSAGVEESELTHLSASDVSSDANLTSVEEAALLEHITHEAATFP